jgi:hypothetical protein
VHYAINDSLKFPITDPKLTYTLEINISLESPVPLTEIQYHGSTEAVEDF